MSDFKGGLIGGWGCLILDPAYCLARTPYPASLCHNSTIDFP